MLVHTLASMGSAAFVIAKNKLLADELAELTLRHEAEPVPPNPEMLEQEEFRRGREFAISGSSTDPGLVELRLSPTLGPPFYVRFDAQWDISQPTSAETIYHYGNTQLPSLVPHRYALSSGGRRRVIARLRFYLTGEAMLKFGMRQVIDVEVPLRISSEGVRVESTGEANQVAASILSPSADGAAVDRQLSLQLELAAPPSSEAAAETDHVIHVLTRPIVAMNATSDEASYTVQPFALRVAAIRDFAGRNPVKFDTWVSLASLNGQSSERAGSEQFEIIVVELPVRVLTERVSFDVQDAVLARRTVEIRQEAQDE